MAPLPPQVYGGTFVFLLLAFVASLFNLYLKRTKKLNKDEAQCVCDCTCAFEGEPATGAHNPPPPPPRPPPPAFSTLGRICCTSIMVATVCLWMIWICTWLHQWHPLIVPTISAHGNPAATGGHR